jgi:hypothetical protein
MATHQVGDHRISIMNESDRDEDYTAIPPAYTELVGRQILAHLAVERAA